MNDFGFRRRTGRPARIAEAAHLYAVGQPVRLKASLTTPSEQIFQVTATLPARDNVLQYRIRSASETYDRVTSQDLLEPVRTKPASQNQMLIDKTFDRA